MNKPNESSCVFCAIVADPSRASIVHQDTLTLAFMDLRQFHNGHVLVIPREHVADIREADDATAAAVMVTVAHVSRAVNKVFPNDGLTVWHSAGEGANQEVPHLHLHVHPRFMRDDVLRVYPRSPNLPPRETLDRYAEELRRAFR